MFNLVVLTGRLTADPELKQTTSGISVCSFSIGVNRRYSKSADQNQQSVDFINIVAWRQQAEFVCKYFKKGSSICVIGSIQTRSWTDNNGAKRYATEVVADEVNFVDSKNENPVSQNAFSSIASQPYVPESYGAPSYTSAGAGEAPKFEEITDDEELPF